MPSLTQRDFEILVEEFGGDEAAARAAMTERGYTVEGAGGSLAAMPGASSLAVSGGDEGAEDAADLAALPGAGNLAGILKGQRKSISDLYDTITQNIQERYRKPDINDLLVNIGVGMMSAPGENDSGGFGGAVQRGLRGIGTYAQNRRAYETDMNKMLSQIEVQKAKDLAGLEEKYLTSAAAAMKPAPLRTVGTQVVNGKIVAVREDPRTGQISTTEIGDAPANLKPIPGVTSGGQPVFMGPNGPVAADGTTLITEFDVKAKPVSATEQKEIFETEDLITNGLGSVKTLEQALALNQQAYEGSLTGWRKTVGQLFSSDDPRYVATENFDNLIMTGALQSLKSIFGGNPTEGERKILLDLQAVSSKPRAVRDEIIRRSLQAAKSRIARETSRLQRLKGGDYGTRGGSTAGAPSRPRVINWGQ